MVSGLEELLKAGIKADDLMVSLPAWVRYPEFERVTWINTFLRGLWPYLDKAVCEEIRAQADPIMKENCPPFLKSISFKELRIGREHLPQITGLKVLKEGEEITIEIKLSWAGDPVSELGSRAWLERRRRRRRIIEKKGKINVEHESRKS